MSAVIITSIILDFRRYSQNHSDDIRMYGSALGTFIREYVFSAHIDDRNYVEPYTAIMNYLRTNFHNQVVTVNPSEFFNQRGELYTTLLNNASTTRSPVISSVSRSASSSSTSHPASSSSTSHPASSSLDSRSASSSSTSHPVSSSSVGRSASSSLDSRPASSSSVGRPASSSFGRSASSSSNIIYCTEVGKPTGCRFGDNCRYSHECKFYPECDRGPSCKYTHSN